VAQAAWGGSTLRDALGGCFQDHDQRIERKALRQHGVNIHCEDTPPLPNGVYGCALNIS
jgi:hypothetical protein